MKPIITALSLLFITTSTLAAPYEGSYFAEVWQTIVDGTYETVPTKKVSTSDFLVRGVDLLLNNSKRTLSSHEDLLPHFDKLLHPNGICLKGSWNITETTPYSGYFATNTQGIIIARASVALSDTTRGNYRGFGMAGKIYPTTDELHQDKLKTANFFVIDDLAGTKENNYTRAAMTNQPEVSFNWGIIKLLGILNKASKALGAADNEPGVRQLYEISELAVQDMNSVVTPKWMMILGESDTVNQPDFRNELNINNYNGSLRFGIYVADTSTKPKKTNSRDWTRIGVIDYNDTATSSACEHQLHFHHPKFR